MAFKAPLPIDHQAVEDRTARPLLDSLRAIRELASSAIEGEFDDRDALVEIKRISAGAVKRSR